MTLFHWSKTAANNGTADVTCPFPEGMGAPALNDGARGMMAAVAKYRDDIAGAIVTGGTSTAYTVLSYQGFDSLADMNGQEVAFSPHITNGDTVLLNVDLLGSKPLRSAPGVELVAGTLVLGTPYMAVYNNADAAWYLKGYYANPYNVPFLGALEYWDTIAPNSTFIFPAGQAISRTVYSRAFARWGTMFGVGDGSTTFNVPDKTERVSVMKAAAASRLSATYFGGNSTVLGAVGGGESDTLAMTNLPASPAPVAAKTATWQPTVSGGAFSAVSSGAGAVSSSVTFSGPGSVLSTSTFSVMDAMPARDVSNNTANLGSATPIRTVQPTIVCNYILRII